MANWAALQEQLTGKQVKKRAKYGIHFDNGDGQTLAHFSGKPCHWQDTDGLWKPIDTRLVLMPDGFYGCPHSPVRVHKDGHVKVTGSDYTQYAGLPSASEGLVDGDKIVRIFSFGEQRLWVTEDGFHSEIVLNRIPTLSEAKKLIASEGGTLPRDYWKSLTTATDANNNIHTFTTLSAFRTWLASAVFPVTIDPDFAGNVLDCYVGGSGANYAVARATHTGTSATNTTILNPSQSLAGIYYVNRSFIMFDTSSIGSSNNVTQVNLKMTIKENGSDTDYDVQIVKYDWSQLASNLSNATYLETAYDGALTADADDNIWRNTSGISTNTQYTSGNLSTAWVNKTGITYYALRSSEDYAGNAPTGLQYVYPYSQSETTESYRPVLAVTYSAAGGFHPINLSAQMQSLTGGMRG